MQRPTIIGETRSKQKGVPFEPRFVAIGRPVGNWLETIVSDEDFNAHQFAPGTAHTL